MKERLCKSLGEVISAITDMHESGIIIPADDPKHAIYGWTLENPETEPVWISIQSTNLRHSKGYPETVINLLTTADGREQFAKAALDMVGEHKKYKAYELEKQKAEAEHLAKLKADEPAPILDRWDEMMF